jgi:hypothetical protein
VENIRSKKLIIWIWLFGWIFTLGEAWSETQVAREYGVKAAMLTNFAKFVDWPSGSFKNETSPIVIGIVGTDPFGDIFEAAKDKTVKGRKVVMRNLPRLENFEDCHILFFSKSEKGNLILLLSATKNYNILTVSDIEKFAEKRGMIGLVTGDNTISIEINLETVKHSNLKFSSQLLKIAKLIGSGP